MSEPGTSAPHQEYPDITPAPRPDDAPLTPDARDTIAADQEYPAIVTAELVVEAVCPCCGKQR